MVEIREANTEKSIKKIAESLKQLIKAPEWSLCVKTAPSKERPPVELDWWYMRAASILRIVAIKGPIGVSKLRLKYGSNKNRGHKPNAFMKGSGKIIRVILQHLESAGLIKYSKEGIHKGRVITSKGLSFLSKNSVKE
jgi:small subunit ribosomal protein S19e